jgi:hypothetical protein
MFVWGFLLIYFVNNLFRRLIMNHLQKHFSASLIALAALLSTAPMAWAANATAPSLGTASTFTILSAAPNAGGKVTCTNGTITGDVGSSGDQFSVIQTNCPISGAIIAPVSAQVVSDFNAALAAGLAISGGTVIDGNLAGQTLSPGVYYVAAASTTTNGTLTLKGSAKDTWTFIIGTSGTGALTGTGLNVVMANGQVVPCDAVTWYVAQAVTMTDSNFVGTIYAGAAITFTRGTFNGNALSAAGVTVTGTTVTGCTSTRHHSQSKCNQGVGNGTEGCDPGNSNQGNPFNSNDELGGVPGDPGRQGGNNNTTTDN